MIADLAPGLAQREVLGLSVEFVLHHVQELARQRTRFGHRVVQEGVGVQGGWHEVRVQRNLIIRLVLQAPGASAPLHALPEPQGLPSISAAFFTVLHGVLRQPSSCGTRDMAERSLQSSRA